MLVGRVVEGQADRERVLGGQADRAGVEAVIERDAVALRLGERVEARAVDQLDEQLFLGRRLAHCPLVPFPRPQNGPPRGNATRGRRAGTLRPDGERLVETRSALPPQIDGDAGGLAAGDHTQNAESAPLP